jgi:hypothetical protein
MNRNIIDGHGTVQKTIKSPQEKRVVGMEYEITEFEFSFRHSFHYATTYPSAGS